MKVNDKRVIDRFIELALIDGESFNERLVADYLITEFQKLGVQLCEDDTAAKIGGNCGNLYGFAEGRGKYADSEPVLFCAHMDTVAPGNNKKIIINDDGTIISDHTTLNIGTIEGGSVTNAVPENCLTKGEIRSDVHEDAYRTMDLVENIFSEEAKRAGAEICIDKKERISVYRKDPGAVAGSALDRYKRALERQGRSAVAKKSFGGSDINSLIKNGMDGLNIYGPMHNIHTTEEYTTVQEIVDFTELVKILMTQT
ncbi:MAG: peptidase dimerization domain-containing protein [Oribacterium sp.]|nr:peptidase dimerization domain-containing protein [Oribacterium sp.]